MVKTKQLVKKVIMVIVPLFFLFFLMKEKFWLLILFLIGSLSIFYLRFVPLPLGMELFIAATVLSSKFYGPKTGLIFGLITTIAGLFVAGKIGAHSFVFLLGMGAVGFSAFYVLKILPFRIAGILMCLLYNIIANGLCLFLGVPITTLIIYVSTNIGWNIVLMSILGGFF